MSIKLYFQLKYTYNIKLNKLEVPTKLDKLEVLLPTLEVPYKPTEPTKLVIKYGQKRL